MEKKSNMYMPPAKIDLEKFMLKELEIIQNIINRMATNSFLIKGWAITLIVATMLLGDNDYQIYLAFIPLIVFWFLDSYFLWQERLYRKLYDFVVKERRNSDKYLFDMDAYRFKNEVDSQIRIMFSKTLIWFYVSIAVLIFIYLGIVYLQSGGLI